MITAQENRKTCVCLSTQASRVLSMLVVQQWTLSASWLATAGPAWLIRLSRKHSCVVQAPTSAVVEAAQILRDDERLLDDTELIDSLQPGSPAAMQVCILTLALFCAFILLWTPVGAGCSMQRRQELQEI